MVFKLKKNNNKAYFSDQFRKSIRRYKRTGYNVNVMRQSACLRVNPITFINFISLRLAVQLSQ